MKLYFAGADNKTSYAMLRKFKVDCLMSYYGLRSQGLGFVEKPIFLDSGAFTAFTKKVKIDLDDYIGFIKENKSSTTVYANLDVIGDWEATKKNQEYMEAHGVKPLPTFHYGSPLEELRRMVKRYNYIALGGLVPLVKHRPVLKNWLDVCYGIIQDKAKVHGFGVNALWAWKRYPFYSVDATSWLVPSRYGQFTEMVGEEVRSHGKTSRTEYGKDLMLRDSKKLLELQIQEYVKMQEFVTRLWEARGVKWD